MTGELAVEPAQAADCDTAAELAKRFPAKVRCAHGYESWALQLKLDKLLGCNFGMGLPVPWQPGAKLLLVVQTRYSGGWYLSWATAQDFESSPLPAIAASELLELIGDRPMATPAESDQGHQRRTGAA